jgi:hypothetical protein
MRRSFRKVPLRCGSREIIASFLGPFYPIYKTERRNRPWLVPISKTRLPVQMLEEENPPLQTNGELSGFGERGL